MASSNDNTTPNVTAQYLVNFGGWVAFVNGQAVRTNDRRVKVFATQAEAMKAAKASSISGF